MNFLSNRIVAALLWSLPVLLLVISVSLVFAGFEQRDVAASGTLVTAEVLEIETQERSEITRGHVLLRYTEPGATASTERAIELPLTFLKTLEDQRAETVDLLMLPGSEQVVLAAHPRGQWILTFSMAAMALVGALGLAWMVFAWNRYLARYGDPALRAG